MIFYLLILVCVGLIGYTMKTYLWDSLFKGAPEAATAAVKTMPGPYPQGFELVTPWEEGRVSIKAVGVPDTRKCKNQAQRRMFGALEARKLGYVELAKAIGKVRITSDSTLENERLKNHALDLAVNEFVLGARETEPVAMQRLPDNSELYIVTLEVLINDPKEGLGKVVLPALQRDEKYTPYQPEKKEPPKPSKYTGLIVDAKGFNILPAMAPKVLLEDGRVVYGVLDVSTDYVQRNGLVNYVKSLEKARSLVGRVGGNPLVVKASGERKNVDLLVSPETAADVKYADMLGNFLDKCKVVFVVD